MSKNNSTDGKVINFNKVRQAKIEEKKRKYERIMFKNVLGAYCVAEGEGLKAIELVDLSPDGLSFQLPTASKNLEAVKNKKEMSFRFYFSEESFITIGVKILNQRPCIENGQTYVRFGCGVDTKTKSYEAYRCFIQFLEAYAETAQQDAGDMKLFFF